MKRSPLLFLVLLLSACASQPVVLREPSPEAVEASHLRHQLLQEDLRTAVVVVGDPDGRTRFDLELSREAARGWKAFLTAPANRYRVDFETVAIVEPGEAVPAADATYWVALRRMEVEDLGGGVTRLDYDGHYGIRGPNGRTVRWANTDSAVSGQFFSGFESPRPGEPYRLAAARTWGGRLHIDPVLATVTCTAN